MTSSDRRSCATRAIGTGSPLPRAGGNWLLVVGVLSVYVAAIGIFFPDVITNIDEACYVAQADGLARGKVRTHWVVPVEGLPKPYQPGEYPVGTAATMAPFVYLLGWRGAFTIPLLSLLGVVLLTARWIEREDKPIVFALVTLAFPATLVLGRVAMSDLPCALLTTSAILLFWEGGRREDPRYWWASGFIAGLTLSFRETGTLVVAPFYLGALLRRERGTSALIVSGLTGTLVRMISGWWVFGDPLHVKNAGYGFSLESFASNLPMYLLFTLVLVPGGLAATLLYRGRRRPEVIAAGLLPVVFFASYEYAGTESGSLKAVILTGRFLIPTLPIYAFCLAHAVPDVLSRVSQNRIRLARILDASVKWLLVAGAASASIAVHVVMDRFNASHLEIREAIYTHTNDGSWVITNAHGTFKYLSSEMYGPRTPIGIQGLEPRHYERILDEANDLHVVLLERTDSAYWLRRSVEYEASIADLATLSSMDLRYDEEVGAVGRLRIWRIDRPDSG